MDVDDILSDRIVQLCDQTNTDHSCASKALLEELDEGSDNSEGPPEIAKEFSLGSIYSPAKDS